MSASDKGAHRLACHANQQAASLMTLQLKFDELCLLTQADVHDTFRSLSYWVMKSGHERVGAALEVRHETYYQTDFDSE